MILNSQRASPLILLVPGFSAPPPSTPFTQQPPTVESYPHQAKPRFAPPDPPSFHFPKNTFSSAELRCRHLISPEPIQQPSAPSCLPSDEPGRSEPNQKQIRHVICESAPSSPDLPQLEVKLRRSKSLDARDSATVGWRRERAATELVKMVEGFQVRISKAEKRQPPELLLLTRSVGEGRARGSSSGGGCRGRGWARERGGDGGGENDMVSTWQ